MATENILTSPYLIHATELQPLQAMQLTEDAENIAVQLDPSVPAFTSLNTTKNSQICVEQANNSINVNGDINQGFKVVEDEQQYLFQIMYPKDLNLTRAYGVKRGRPRKKKTDVDLMVTEDPLKLPAPAENVANLSKSARTRSGRLVKMPKHIEKDFKKIDISTDEQEIQVSDFKRFEEKENSKMEFASLHTKKRMISAQYKCPKCLKAYLGKNKMIQHLKKYPDHGPFPEGFHEFNFDVWNYLFDITQKCKPGQRGAKFCEELSNLLHNVQLLKSALFKTVTDNKNCVQIDKVLGNAIGLTPGKYKFDENELYKDVTVLKLITNSEFFKPNINNKETNDGINEITQKGSREGSDQLEPSEIKKLKQEFYPDSAENECSNSTETQNILDSNNDEICSEKNDEIVYSCDQKLVKHDNSVCSKESDNTEKIDVDSQMLHSELLSENLLLHSLPNPRNSVDDLMLTNVENGPNLLDSSTSSDEVMNVDQFVNERFKKIIEPDIELSNTLNLDLPSLELFQFHTT